MVKLHKLAKCHYQTVYFPSYSVKCASCLTLRHLMTSWQLNIWKVKIWLSQERKELSQWHKKHFSLFHQFSPLKSDSYLPKIYVICLIESPLKVIKNAFYFILKALFVLKIFKFLSWLFGHVEKSAWLER